jgi:hypothetical protein
LPPARPDGRWWSLFLRSLDARLRLEAAGTGLPLAEVHVGTRPSGL